MPRRNNLEMKNDIPRSDAWAMMKRGFRRSDVLEVQRASGRDIITVFPMCVKRSQQKCCLYLSGTAIAAGGVAWDSFRARGEIWWLATPDFEDPKLAPAIGRITKLYFERNIAPHWPVLGNYVDAENTTTLAWLTFLGFSLEPPVPYGANGELFRWAEYKRRAA